MAIINWYYDLALRTSHLVTGTPIPVHYFIAYDDTTNPPLRPLICGPVSPSEKVELAREGIDWSQDPVLVGVRKHLKVSWANCAAYIVGSTARTLASCGTQATNLGTILTDLFTAGMYLEVSVVALDSGGAGIFKNTGGTAPTWRVCYIDSDVSYVARDGRNVSLGLELTFAQKALSTTVGGVTPGDW